MTANLQYPPCLHYHIPQPISSSFPKHRTPLSKSRELRKLVAIFYFFEQKLLTILNLLTIDFAEKDVK